MVNYIHTHPRNAVPLAWGLLRLARISLYYTDCNASDYLSRLCAIYVHAFLFAIILYAPLNPAVKSCGCSEIFSVGGGETTNTKGNRYGA